MNFDIASMLYSLPAVLIGLTAHEYAHAWAAYKLGDSTAKEQGRLSLNPLKHIDPLGFLFLVVAGFGWAKPVRFSRESLKAPKRDEALIAAAGPLANLALALLGSVLLRLLVLSLPALGRGVAGEVALTALLSFVYVNYGLFVFNLIPIPPLDGSHILFGALTLKPETEARVYRFGTYALLAILLIDGWLKVDILPIGKAVRAMAGAVFGLLGF
jgi:Zn-dependent protease